MLWRISSTCAIWVWSAPFSSRLLGVSDIEILLTGSKLIKNLNSWDINLSKSLICLSYISPNFMKWWRTDEKLGRSLGSSVQQSIMQGNIKERRESRFWNKRDRVRCLVILGEIKVITSIGGRTGIRFPPATCFTWLTTPWCENFNSVKTRIAVFWKAFMLSTYWIAKVRINSEGPLAANQLM